MYSTQDINILANLSRNHSVHSANSFVNSSNTKRAAQDLSGQFIQILLEESLKSAETEGGFFGKGHAADMIRSMFVAGVSKSMASTNDGMGITSMLEKAISRQQQLGSQSTDFSKPTLLKKEMYA